MPSTKQRIVIYLQDDTLIALKKTQGQRYLSHVIEDMVAEKLGVKIKNREVSADSVFHKIASLESEVATLKSELEQIKQQLASKGTGNGAGVKKIKHDQLTLF